MRARYEIDRELTTAERLVIRDVGHETGMSITNDAEAVLADVIARGLLTGQRRLFYYDSQGELTEIVVRDGRFAGFAPFQIDW